MGGSATWAAARSPIAKVSRRSRGVRFILRCGDEGSRRAADKPPLHGLFRKCLLHPLVCLFPCRLRKDNLLPGRHNLLHLQRPIHKEARNLLLWIRISEQQPNPESRSAGWIYLLQIRVYIIFHIQPDHLIPVADLQNILPYVHPAMIDSPETGSVLASMI